MIIACMCTFPARGELILPAIDSLYNQVDKIRICLNEYTEIPSFLDKYEKLDAIIPDTDQRDVGKFLDIDAHDEDVILYVDDDIIYPEASLQEKKYGKRDVSVAFISDLHIGSTMFLEKNLLKFIKWLNGQEGDEKQKSMASKVKYLFTASEYPTTCRLCFWKSTILLPDSSFI